LQWPTARAGAAFSFTRRFIVSDTTRKAKRLRNALKSIYGDDEPADSLITDTLTDLRHLCDFEGLSLSDLDRIAQGHYVEEKSTQLSFQFDF
jgi:hypothetical protein